MHSAGRKTSYAEDLTFVSFKRHPFQLISERHVAHFDGHRGKMRRVNVRTIVIALKLPAYHRSSYQVGIKFVFFESSDYFSVTEHRQRIALFHNFIEIVRDKDHGFIFIFHPLHKPVYYVSSALRKRRRRFVNDKNLRVMEHYFCDFRKFSVLHIEFSRYCFCVDMVGAYFVKRILRGFCHIRAADELAF